VPAPLPAFDDTREVPTVQPYLTWWVRGLLLGLVVGLLGVFGLAACLNPYEVDGTPLLMETHSRRLGLPPCTFKTITENVITGGVPCPSCGMTTSFALLMHGDVVHSLRANWVGTLLALYGLILVPWSLASILFRRPLFLLSLERALSWSITVFLVLMLLRWSVVLAQLWWERQAF
jgi:hypothetical protein